MRNPRPCRACGRIFQPRKAGSKWTQCCNRDCANDLLRGKRTEYVTLTCAVCGKRWEESPGRAVGRKTCSTRCAAQLRNPGLKQRRGPANPNYKTGQRSGERNREGERRFQDVVAVCRHPECYGDTTTSVDTHHVVYRQEVRRQSGDEWDPDNALSLCHGCHSSHHKRGTRIVPLAALRDTNYEFAEHLLGADYAYEYLRRRYAGDDPRLDALRLKGDKEAGRVPGS